MSSWFEVLGARLELNELEGLPIFALTVPVLVALLPVLLCCALAIKLDSPGPVLFRQRRIGRDGRPFELLKFRATHGGHDRLAGVRSRS